MKRAIFSFILLLVVVGLVRAEDLPLRIAQWQPNVCRVTAKSCGQRSCFYSNGSGVYLGIGLVLTAHHVIEDDRQISDEVSVIFRSGKTFDAAVVGYDARSDQAFLQVREWKQIGPKGVLLASEEVRPGDVVWKCGYGGDGKLYWHKCSVLELSGEFWFRMSSYSRGGDSGGPIFNDLGELVGNLWGTGSSDTIACRARTTKVSLGAATFDVLVEYHKGVYGDECYETSESFYLSSFGIFGRKKRCPPLRQQPAPGWIKPPILEPDPPILKPKPPPPKSVPTPPMPPQPTIVGPAGPPGKTGPQKSEDTGFSLRSLIFTGATSAIGLALPTWAVMAYRGTKVVRRLRKRRRNMNEGALPLQEEEAPSEDGYSIEQDRERYPGASSRTVVVDSPPRPTHTLYKSEFITAESDNFRRAYESARQEIFRKFPGSKPILEAEKSLTLQFLSGQPDANPLS